MDTVWLVMRRDMYGNSDDAVAVFLSDTGAREWVNDQIEIYYSRVSHYWGENNFGNSVCYVEKGDNTLCSFTLKQVEVYP